MQKISLFHLFISEIQSILESHDQTGNTQNIFDQLLNLMNLYQHSKNEAILSICSGEIVDLKILKSDWSILAYILGTIFSPVYHLCSNIANNIYFHYRMNWVKTNDQSFL